jgi:DNA polymerase/3'-5' exonuclease PolX
MEYSKALDIAQAVVEQLRPHTERIEIAGSIRRKKPEVKDIEVVCIPNPYDTGLFENGLASVVNRWQKVKGELPCKYTQRILPEGIKLDLFFAVPENWGLIYAMRTGSAEYSSRVLGNGWVKSGYHSINGMLNNGTHIIEVREEEDLFRLIGIPWVEPEKRNL